MPPQSDVIRKFTEGGGDALLKLALEEVEPKENVYSNVARWTMPNGERTTYNGALAYMMNHLNREQQLSQHVFSGDDVRRRLNNLDGALRTRARLLQQLHVPTGPVLLQPSVSLQPANPLDRYAPIIAALPQEYRDSLSSLPREQRIAWFHQNWDWLYQNGYLSNYRSLGSLRPLRHAVIYGEEGRRF
ncbi:hypothetical protein JCM8547_006663 [Rhodosporidiobolus lusitaniae]